MDHRDDWPDRLLEGDLDSAEGLAPAERRSAEQIAREARNMNAVLSAMASQLSEELPAMVGEDAAAERRRRARRWQTLAPLAAAAAVAALILARGEGSEDTGGPAAGAGAPTPPSMVSEIDVEADRPFVVFPTSDPDIAVVWLLNPKESD